MRYDELMSNAGTFRGFFSYFEYRYTLEIYFSTYTVKIRESVSCLRSKKKTATE
jgi:hypothetical protein